MEDSGWERRLQALTHILTSPTTQPDLYSQFFISSQIPNYLDWDYYPPVLCRTKTFPNLHLRWGFSLFLKRVSRFGFPKTSWRSKCPYQQPPPLILADGVEEAQWSDEGRLAYLRKRRNRKRRVRDVHPLIALLSPYILGSFFVRWLWKQFPDPPSLGSA